MGYFPNGTAGIDYEERFCWNCIHYHEEFSCPCLDAHILWNYEECNKKNSILHKMIPRDRDGHNKKCLFYYEKPIWEQVPHNKDIKYKGGEWKKSSGG